MGRGGAAFPTGRKWEAVARQPRRPHYLICNADESEPGTFKDRVILEGDPFSVIEAMTIAAYATGCEHGYIYLRGEYPLGAAPAGERAGAGPRARPPRRRHPRSRLALRHRAPQGRRRVHLRRGDRDLRLDRGLPRGAAQQAAVPGRARAVRPADGRQQRRDAGQHAADRARGRRGVRGDRHRALDRDRSCSASRALSRCRASTRCRSGPRCASCSNWQAASAPAASCARCCSAARPAASSRPSSSICRSRSRTPAPPARRSVPGVVVALDDAGRSRRAAGRDRRVLPRRELRPVRAVPGGTVRQEEAAGPAASGRTRGTVEDELALIAEIGEAMRDASICGLGQTASSAIESAIERARSIQRRSCQHDRTADGTGPAPPARLISLTIDDRQVEVPEGSTILDACNELGIDTPTLCYGETLTPANACRICVVELGGRADPGPGVLAQGRAGHGDPHRLAAGPPQPQDGDRVPGLIRRSVDHARRRSDYLERYDGRSGALRTAGAAGPGP